MSPARVGASEIFGNTQIGRGPRPGPVTIGASDLFADGSKKYRLSQVPIAAFSNAIPDTANLLTELYKGATDNPGEFIKSIPKTVIGMGERAISPFIPSVPQKYAEQYADPLHKHIARSAGFKPAREGEGSNLSGVGFPTVNWDYEQLKQNIAERPAHTALDAAIVTGMGKGLPGRLGTASGTVARALNPLTPVARGITTVAKTAGKVIDKASDLPVIGNAAKAVTKTLNPRLAAVNELPTTAEFKKQRTSVYAAAEREGANLSQSTWARLSNGMLTKMKTEGFDPRMETLAANAFTVLREKAAKGHVTFSDAEAVRQSLNSLERSTAKSTSQTAGINNRMVTIMRSYLDDFMNGIKDKDQAFPMGDPTRATALFKEARSLHKQSIKSAKLDELHYQAELDAGTNYTQSGLENAVRRRYGNMATCR